MDNWVNRAAIAVALISLLLAGALPSLTLHFSILTALSITTLAVMEFRRRWHPRDPYSLTALRELAEKEEIQRIHREHEQVPKSFDVVCRHCGTVYREDWPVCPHCRGSKTG